MIQFILRNRLLLFLTCCLLLQLLCLGLIFLGHHQVSNAFTSLKGQYTDINFDFWKLIRDSGKAMNTRGLIVRLTNYQDEILPRFISNFLGSTVQNTNLNGHSANILSNFKLLNIFLQISTGSIWLFCFLLAVNLITFSRLLWRFITRAQLWPIYKLLLSTIFPGIGFAMSYMWEQQLLLTNDPLLHQESEYLNSLKWVRKIREFRGVDSPLIAKNRPLIEVKGLHLPRTREGGKWVNGIFRKMRGDKNIPNKGYILKDINLSIRQGSFNVIIGPNGSGKTTLIKSLINLNENVIGKVLWNNREVKLINRRSMARKVSYVPQLLNINQSINVVDFLFFARYPYMNMPGNTEEINRGAVRRAIGGSGCENFVNKNMDELSGGQRQKILLASILVQDPEVIILDEPMIYLDIRNQFLLLESLKELNRRGKTIIMILHDLQQAINYADNLIVMRGGELYRDGNPRKIMDRSLLRDIFNIDCNIIDHGNRMEIRDIRSLSN